MKNPFRRMQNSLRELALTYLLIGLFFAVGAFIFARGQLSSRRSVRGGLILSPVGYAVSSIKRGS